MNCAKCKCNTCARNCELPPWYFTPGEIADVELVCYTCDECRWWNGDFSKRNQCRRKCEGYQEAAKHIEARMRHEEKWAQTARKKFIVIRGGKK